MKNFLGKLTKRIGSRAIIACTALGLTITQDAVATHSMGGDLSYECVGSNQYLVTLNFYRDCNGVDAPLDCSNLDFEYSSAQCGVNESGCFTFSSFQNITPICFAAPDVCNDPNGQFGVEWYVYTALVDLSPYSGCGTDWLIEWDIANRNNAITSLVDPGDEQLYISALLNNTLDACNSSPVFLNDPTPFTCINTQINYNHGVSDPDGDSLVFSFAPARGENGGLIPYAPGYSFDNPILTAGGADQVAINPVTGTITAVPNQVQFSVVSVLVQEYRNQVLIGEFTRDVQFSITNLPSCSNNYPTASGVNGTTDYAIEICADSSFCFDIITDDLDVTDSIYVSWNGGISAATFNVGPGLQPTATFCWTPTASDIGTHLFSVTVRDNACVFYGVSSYGYAVTVTPPDTPADAGSDQVICATSTTLQGVLPFDESFRQWTLVSGSGTINNPNDPNTLVTGLGVGDNVFQWTIDYQTCGIESDQVTITVHDPAQASANAGPDQELCLPSNSATLEANSYVYPALGTWSVVLGAGTFADVNNPLTGVSGLAPGLNNFLWTMDNGPCAAPSTDQVSIFVFDPTQPAANAGPDQEFCTPTSTAALAGNALTFPASGNWTLESGSGSITNPSSPTSGVTGLAVGENIFRWTISNGPCVPGSTQDEVSIFIFALNAPVANAGTDREICTPVSSTTLSGNTPLFPASGTWSLVSGSGTIADPTDPGTLITGLAVGENIFEWEVDNGPCGSPTTDEVSVFVFDAVAPVATAGPDQDFCTPTNVAAMAANTPLFPATGTWSLVAGTGNFTDANNPTTTVTGLTVGVNTFRWTISNGPCPTASTQDEITVTIFDNNTPLANAGADQEFCSPTSSTTVTGNILLGPAAGLWTLVSGTGNIAQPTNPVSTITGLSVGENVFEWAVDNGPCNAPTTDQISIFIFDVNSPVADAGADQNFCTPTTSTNMTGSTPVFPSIGTWTLVSGGGAITDVNDPNSAITGIPIGENIFQWTVDNGPCATGITSDQITIFIFDENNPVADAGQDQQLCTPTTSTALDGSVPIFPASGTWTVVSGSGNFTDVNDPNATVSGLSIGDNVMQWAMSNGPCSPSNSTDQVTISVFDLNAAPANAGPDVDLCSPSSTYTMTANTPTAPGVGTWVVLQGTGTFSDMNDPVALMSGMSVGENIFEWQIDNGVCGISTDQVSIFIFDPNAPAANAGPDQDLCSPASSATMAANSAIFPGSGQWVLISGAGSITDPTDPFTSITGLPIGEHIFQWTIDNGPCAVSGTSDQITISIFDENAVASNAGPDQEFCTPTSTSTLAANLPTFPATGVWSLMGGTGTIAQPANPFSAVSGLSIGENIFQWTIDNGPCASGITTDQISIFIFDETNAIANAGPDQELCTPISSAALAGSAVVFPAVGTWSVVQGTGLFTDANNPGTAVNGLSVGENIFEWSVSNGPCANGITTDQVSIFIFDNNNASADAGADQEFCSPTSSTDLDGSNVVVPAIGTWILIQGTGVFADVNDPATNVTGLTIGENIFEWEVSNGPCASGISSDQVSIFIFDENSPVADAGPDQAICTPASITNMAGSVPVFPSIGTWTLIHGNGFIANPNSPNTLVTGLTVGSNEFVWTVDNGPCATGLTTDTVVIEIFDETAGGSNAGPDQAFCTPVSSANMAGNAPVFPAIGTWSLVSGSATIGDVNDPNTLVSDMPIGTHVFEWTMDNGPCDAPGVDQVSILIFDETNADAFAGIDREFCTPESSTNLAGNTPVTPAVGTWSLMGGGGTIADPNDPNTLVSDLPIGENIFEWAVDNGPCANGTTTDQVSIFIFDETNPNADAGPDQDLCSPISTATLTGSSLTFPATGLWSLTGGTGNIVDNTASVTNVTGLTVGENIFVWEVSNGPCANGITTDTVSIFIFDETNANANAGLDQELCTPDDSTSMAADIPQFPAIGTWTLLGGTATIADVNDPNTAITGMPVGTHIFEWSVDNGPCSNGVTTDQVSIFVFDSLAAPADAGPDQELCLPVISTTMAGNAATPPGVGTWTLVSGAGTIANANDPNTAIDALAVGENIFVWEIYNGPCQTNGLTTDTVSIFLFDDASANADAGQDQDFCTPTSTATLNGNTPIFPSTGEWTLVSGSADIADPSAPVTNVLNMPVGEHIFQWTVDNGPCANDSTSDQVSIFIFDENAADADAGPDQLHCTPTNTTFLEGNTPVFPATGEWSLLSGTGSPVDPTNPSTEVTGLTIGENIFEWTVDNGPCANGITSDLVSIFVYDSVQPPADAGMDQDLCTPNTFTDMNGSPVIFPAVGVWTLLNGTGTFADPNDPSATVTGLSIGENTFIWAITNGPCDPSLTMDTVSIFLFDGNALDAMAGPDQDFCSPLASTTMLANAPVFPAEGTWFIANGSGDISDLNDPFAEMSNLGWGENVFEWQIDNGPCGGTSSDQVSIFLYDSEIPTAYAGEYQQHCEPISETYLEADPAENTGVGSWQLISGTGTIADASDPESFLSDLVLGDNVFVWTVDNGTCGTTSDTVTVNIKDCTTITIPDAFSPNGDGTNDDFVIPNIEYYPENNFKVFNRWGDLVFEAAPYTNDWDGHSQKGFSTGEGLPESTYYYILELGDGSDGLNGFIYLRK